MIRVSFVKKSPEKGALALGVAQGNQFGPYGQSLNERHTGLLSRAIGGSRFQGKARQQLCVLGSHDHERIVLFGVGDPTKGDEAEITLFGGDLGAHLMARPHQHITIVSDFMNDAQTLLFAFGIALRVYHFHKYYTTLPDDKKPVLESLAFVVEDPEQAEAQFAPYRAVVESVHLSRNLISEPPNVMTPRAMVEAIETLKPLGLEVEVLDRPAMRKLGMGALLGVAQGSDNEPYLAVMRWNGGKAGEAPLAFVGKGVTFDTGGISIKPSLSMDEMKGDMAGAAVVVGLLRTLAAVKAPVNAVGVVALVENMPSGKAQRPGDVVKSMSGQTIEVLNTDAEGRLILADALYYTHVTFKPRYMVDLATLTGAMRIALGDQYAGLFSMHDDLAHALEKASKVSGEGIWRLPMGPAYDKQLNSPIADIQNIAAPGYGAGSILGAQFLARFVGDTPWAHLDIANMDIVKKNTDFAPKGYTGFGVILLWRWVQALTGTSPQ